MDGETVASIGASGPADRITLERMADLGKKIRTAADKITNALGGADFSNKK
jgi:DNA-binding IclR family transcriptional regulator